MKKSILKTMSLLLCTAMMAIIMLPQAAFAATDYTCYIGSNGYSTLAEAVEAANTGDTIWMTANDSVSTTFDVDKNLTIELEGYTLANACMRFVGDITVNINDRAGTAKINTNQNSGFKVTDYEYDSRVRAAFYLTGGAKVILSGTTGGTEIYGGAQCTDGLTILEKAAVVGKGCELVINGGSLVYSGYTGTDGVFVCDTGILTLKDILIRRSSSNTGGASISYANVPTIENPLTITKGHFYGGMWVEGSSTINGVYISRGTLSFDKIEKALLYNSVGSYIDYDKSTNSNGWEIFVASENLSTDTDIDNVVDSTETLRVSAGGNVSADAGQKVVFQPQVTGGDGMSEITYAWTKDGADTGVTTDAFVIEATTSADAGEYVFTATQGSNSVSCTYVLSVQAENHSHHDISFDKWSEMTDLPIMSGNYYLENEVTLSAIWTVPQGVTNLCINGRVIDLNSYYINVPAGAALNIYTCEDLKQYYDVSDNLWIPVGGFTDENKERYTSGGVITGGSNSAIFVNGGFLTLNGGAIAGNTGNAGGVTLMNGATFTMNDGDIVGNTSKGDAGGVMNNNSTFTINGGRIHNNYAANNGGGVFNVYENALFTMNGGKIYDNISSGGAGGIGNYEDAEMIVTGGSICGNSTTWGGGGIFNYHSTLTLMGGVIDNNSSTWGGGAVFNEGILHISGAPVIKDNFVNETPNNIYLLYPEFPIVVDGPISSGPIPVSVYPDEGQLDNDFKFTESTDVSLNDASDFEYEYEGYRVEKKNDGQLYIVAYEEPEYEAENGGSVEVTENDDGTVTLSVSVPDGFRFVGWHDGETIISTDNPYTFVPEAGKTYTAKIEKDTTEVESRLFSTDSENAIGLLTRAYMEGLFAEFSDIKGVVLTDLRDHNLEGVKTLDYSADGDGSVLAWRTDDVLYIGGYGKIIANTSLAGAFHGGTDVEYIEGLSLLDTSNVTDMSYMFATCGWYSTRFTLDLGDNFDTSNVTTMSCMFERCGQNSLVFTLDLGDKFNTSNVTDMYGMFMLCGAFSEYFTLDLGDKFDTSNVEIMQKMFTNCGENCKVFTLNLGDKFDTSNATDMYGMFKGCGKNSEVFDVLDLSGFTVSSNVDLEEFAYNIPATTFIFGEGWKNATLPSAEVFYASSEKATTVVNAVDNLFAYDWAADNRVVTYEGTQPEEEPKYEVENGGTIDIVENEDGTVTLYVSVPDGFSFVGWHDGTKIISTDNPYTFVPEAGKTYTAKLEEIQPDPVNKYTITANATDGGVAEGTATVEEGQNVTLTAAANEGYKFIGWYDGDVLVCETEDFVVENIIANATYTARFVLVENEEPEEPDTPSIPELSFDGETLTLVDESEVALRVGVSYVGSAVFDEKNVDWDRMVYVGRKFEEINGENGYQVYENFTSRSFDKAGNYVSYVKYAIGENVSSYYYLFTVAGEADTIALPWLAFSDNTLTMVNEMKISATVGYAYVGAEVFESYKIDWDRLVEVGKNYSDINTEKGYVRIPDITEFSKEFSRDGNYVAYIKYIDPNSGKTVSEYITFTVGSAPVVTADRGRIVVEANGNELLKVTVAYIGDNDNQITDWTSFTQASNAYKEINGDPQKQQYSALKTTNRFAQERDGYYAVYVRYTNESGEKVVRYDTVYVDNTDAIVKPAAQGSQDGNISIADEGYEILKVTIAYIGTTEKTVYDWNGFMEAANVFNDVNGDPPMQQYFNVEHGKLFKQKHDGYYLVYIRYNDSGTARSTYSTVWVDGSNIVSPEINADTGYIVLSDNGFYVQKMTIAYIGDKDKEICTWSQFMAASNVYKDINGEPQKQQYHSPSNGSEFLQSQDGWYAAYIRYIDDNGSEVVIYRTLEVKDTALATLPEAVADGADIVINCNGHEVTKATIAYIGDEEKKITNWNEFSDASNVYKDINGDPQKQQYHNPENGTAVTQDKTGYYAVYLRYIENGVAKTVYGVVYVEA